MIKLSPLDVRFPNWNYNELEERHCPISASTNHTYSFTRPDNLNVRHCTFCNSYFISPSPTELQLTSFYSHYDDIQGKTSHVSFKDLKVEYQRTNPLSDIKIRELCSYISMEKLKILDVGCGKLKFLYQLQKLGAIPFGIDLDEVSVKIAKYLNINTVFLKTLQDLPIQYKFDIITFNDVIEHPLKPMLLLNTAVDLLVKDGLMLLWTPNGNISNTDLDPITFRLDLEHMQYLTIDSINYLVSKLNMRILHLETVGFPKIENIDKPIPNDQKIVEKIKKLIKKIPGFNFANDLRHKNFSSSKDYDRTGTYHLFCILQKKNN